jgi:hypothetical protein
MSAVSQEKSKLGAPPSAEVRQTPILGDFVTREGLAEQIDKNPRTLDRWDALGIGPPRTRIGRTVLYRRTSVEKWLVAQEHSHHGPEEASSARIHRGRA